MAQPYRILVERMVVVSLALAGCNGDKTPTPPTCAGVLAPRTFPNTVDTTFPTGPIVSHTTTVSTTIMWELASDCGEDGNVAFGMSGEALTETAYAQSTGLIRKAALTGLAPDTVYDYQVSCCGLVTAPLSFATAPPATAPIRFTVLGDTHANPTIMGGIVAQMMARHPHLVVHTGDEVNDGAVHTEWQDGFWAPLRQLGHYLPTYAAMGNHENHSDYYFDYHAYPFTDFFIDRKHGAFYSFTYGTVFFLMIDTTDVTFALASFGETQLTAWIREELASAAARNATWRIAVGHYGAFSDGWESCDSGSFAGFAPVAEWLFPLLAENGFQAYFAGHTHDYERGVSGGVAHIISGGGGGSLDQRCRELPEVEVVELRHHYVVVDATCDSLTLNAYDSQEDTVPFDTLTIGRPRVEE